MQSWSEGFPSETQGPLPMIFLNRSRAGTDNHLEWKVRLFLLGAALAMVGIGLESTVLVVLAILVLVAGAALRFLPGGDAAEGAGEEAAPPSTAEPAMTEDPDSEG